MTNTAEQIRDLINKGFRTYDITRMLKISSRKITQVRREMENGYKTNVELNRSYRNDTFIMNAY